MSKFYPLEHEEWLRACHELTPSERDVLYYLRTADPYSNGIRICAAEIARSFSTPKHTVHRQTISRALKSLEAKGFIDLEILEANARVLSRGKLSHPDTGVLSHHQPVENGCVITPSVSHRTMSDRHTPQAIATHQPTSTTHTEIGFQNSKISKTYKTYKDQIDRSVFDLENGNQTKAIAIAEVLGRSEAQESESSEQPTNTGEGRSSPAPTDDRKILDFIIKTIVRKGVDLANPEAYAKKCLQQNGDHWRSLYAESKRPNQPIKEYTDPYQAESSIAMAIKMGDKDFARGKLENLRQRGEEALADRLSEKFGGALCR